MINYVFDEYTQIVDTDLNRAILFSRSAFILLRSGTLVEPVEETSVRASGSPSFLIVLRRGIFTSLNP